MTKIITSLFPGGQGPRESRKLKGICTERWGRKRGKLGGGGL